MKIFLYKGFRLSIRYSGSFGISSPTIFCCKVICTYVKIKKNGRTYLSDNFQIGLISSLINRNESDKISPTSLTFRICISFLPRFYKSSVVFSMWYEFLSDELRVTNSATKPVRKRSVPMIIAVNAKKK